MSSQIRIRRMADTGLQDSSKLKQQTPREEEEGVEEMIRKIREIVKRQRSR